MKRHIRNYFTAAGRYCVLLATCYALVSCGGGYSDQTAGIGGTGIVVGKITGFGSIFVNGVEYDTNGSSFLIDDTPEIDEDKLEVGMVVRLSVETSNGELTRKATEVVYDGEVKGPVTGLSAIPPGSTATQRSLSIFGQAVTVDSTGTVFKGTTFVDLADGDIVEISGFRESATMIRATYVKKKGTLDPGNSEVDLRGKVDQYLGGNDFEINGVVINIDPLNTVIDVPGGLSDGKSVEVKGVIQLDGSINADEIKFDDDDEFDGEIDEISLQGIISSFSSISDFEIDGLTVDASSVLNLPTLPADPVGLEVEVEGDLVGGVLVADKFELRQSESRVEAKVGPGSVNLANKSFAVYYQNIGATVTVKVNDQTLFEDEISINPEPSLSLGDLMDNDFVRVEGQEVGGELVANVVKRVDDEGDFRLAGAVDTFVPSSSITILGIPFTTDSSTEYEEGAMSAAEFYGQLSARPNGGVGTLVEIQDDAVTYGIADEVGFED